MKPKKILIVGDKVTPQEVEDAIIAEHFRKLGQKIVVCHLTLRDGFEVIGKAGVVDPALFDMSIGKKVAREKALDEVWAHMGSILQDRKAE